MNKKFLKKTVALTTSIATTLSVSGISLLAPVVVLSSSHIGDGDTIKTADSFDVWIVKQMGTKKFKRLILNPAVFSSYGHLSWSKVKTVSSADAAAYTESKLVRAVGDPKVYELSSAPNSDTGQKKWLNMTAAEFTSAGNDWDSIYQINTVDRDNYTAAADITPTTPAATPVPTTGKGVEVSLAADTPVADSVAMGSQDRVFAKINFKGNENTTITAIAVTRGGLANDSDLSEVQLWDGSTELGSAQAINSTTHKATFTGLSWVVPVGLTKTLTITGSIAASGTAATSTAPKLGIAAAADITADKTVSGTFPVVSNTMTIAGLAIGRLDVVVRSVPANLSPVSGSTDQEIASWTFSAVNEGMTVKRIKITQTGSAGTADLSNIKLKINGVQIGSTVASLASDGTAVFDLASDPISIISGASKIVYAHTDVAAGINTSRTIDFEVTNAQDVTAIGQSTSGSVVITGSSGATFTTQSGTAQTISQGTIITLAMNGATNPSAQRFVRGEKQVLVSAFRFSNGAGEDQRVTRVKLTLAGTGADATDAANVTLYKYDETAGTETQVGTPTSFVGLVATFGIDTTPALDAGLFDVVKSKNVVIHVRIDITSSAAWTGDNFEIFVDDVQVDGIQSKADLNGTGGSSGTSPAVTSVISGNATDHFASSNNGILTWALSAGTPSAQNVVPGTKDFKLAAWDVTMAREGGVVSSFSINACDDGGASTGCVASAGANAEANDLTNVKFWNGTTQLGSTVASLSSGVATFNFNLVLTEDKSLTLHVTADVPTTAADSGGGNGPWANSTLGVALAATTTAPVVTGSSSSASLPAASLPLTDSVGNVMTASLETLTAAFQAVPATTIIINASQAVVSRLVLRAGTAGDIRVSSIKFTASSSTTLNAAGGSAADTEFGNLKLFDGATQVGTTLASFTNASGGDTATFSGLSLTVPKGTSKLLELKSNVLAATDVTAYVGIVDLTNGSGSTDVVATGLSSNSTVYGTGTDNSNSGAITLASAGTLAVAADAATPLSAYVAVGVTGKTGVDFMKFRLTATNEPIDFETIVISLAQHNNTGVDNNDVDNFASLQLFDGTTAVSSKAYPTGTNTSAQTYTFTFSPLLRVAKGTSKTITLRADLNGTSNGANSTTTPNFFISDVVGATDGSATRITARGVDSGARVTSSAGTPNPETLSGTEPSSFNAMTIVRSKPVFALCTAANCSKAAPSGSLVPGITEVIRFRVTAEGDDVTFTSGTHNIRFTVAQSGGVADPGRQARLFEVGKAAVLQTVASTSLTTVMPSMTACTGSTVCIEFASFGTTIPNGTYREFYADVDLQDYVTTGETFRLSVENAAADLSWGDGVTTDISIANLTDGLPMVGGTLTK